MSSTAKIAIIVLCFSICGAATFITSTTRELSPVVKVDDRVVGSGKPGPVTTRLLKRYQQQAEELTRPKSVSR